MSVTEEEITADTVAAAMAETPDTDGDVDEDGEGEDEPTSEPEEIELHAPGINPEVMDKLYKAAERSFADYTRNRIEPLNETGAVNLFPCPLCPSPNKGFVDLNFAGAVPAEVIEQVNHYLGFTREIAYEQDPETQTCQRCKGEGIVATGSHVKTASRKVCPTCNGYGCQPPPTSDPLATPVALPTLAPITEAAPPPPDADRDPTGEPRILPDGRENPNFGKWPQFKVQVLPWGQTAGLTAQDTVG